MKHYDELELESFALEGDIDPKEKEKFEQHIKICHTCRTFYEEIVQFYQIHNGVYPVPYEQKELEESKSLVISPRYIIKREPTAIYKLTSSLPMRIWENTIKRPARSAISFAASFAMIAFALNTKSIFKDTNPAYIRHNDETCMLEVYNKEDEKLWQVGWQRAKGIYLNEINQDISFTQVADLNKDGKNEVITILRNLGDEKLNVLRIFDSKQNLLISKELGESFVYKNEHFLSEFYTDGLIVDDFNGDGWKEIIVNIPDKHSADILLRLDHEGNTIGEYWHNGHFLSLKSIDLFNNGRKEIILRGSEDKEKNAIIVVLDPAKIIRKTEATQTLGFNLNLSSAEIYYIKFPNPDIIEDPLVSGPSIRSIGKISDSAYNFTWVPNRPAGFSILYYFSNDMKPIDVKLTDGSRREYLKLISERKIKKMPDQKYLDDLKSGIRYWDGKEWKKEWCRVNSAIVFTPSRVEGQ